MRTALGQFSFALVVLKIFTAEFYSIGALFATYGAGIMLVYVWFGDAVSRIEDCAVGF